MNITHFHFSLLYSVYTWPNVALPFLNGHLMDSVVGVRTAFVACSAAVLLGQVPIMYKSFLGKMYGMWVCRKITAKQRPFSFQIIVVLGSFDGSFTLMVVGRLISGLGGESIAVASGCFATTWFSGKEITLAFGIIVGAAYPLMMCSESLCTITIPSPRQMISGRIGSAAIFSTLEPLYNVLEMSFDPK